MRKLDPPCPLGDIAAHLGAEIDATAASLPIDRMATLASAEHCDLSFLADPRYKSQLQQTRAGAVLVKADQADLVPAHCIALIVPDAYLAFARISVFLRDRLNNERVDTDQAPAIHATACVDPRATIDASARIGAHAVIGALTRIGPDCHIGAGCVIGERVTLGAGCSIHANVTICDETVVGSECIVQSGTVIGSDGFGYARDGQGWRKIAQLGAVIIGKRVEIGANCSIDRGALGDTVIEDGCILDNLIQVAHNVRIGAGSALAGCVGIAGSATIGRGCMIGGGAGILGHLELADGVVLSPMSLVTRSLKKAGFYSGTFPLMDNAQWEKAAAALRRLPDLRIRLRQIEKLTRESE